MCSLYILRKSLLLSFEGNIMYWALAYTESPIGSL